MIKEYALLIWRGIKHRKLRTALTVLGIVIGIGAVVALMLVSDGLQNSIKDEFAKIGTNSLFVTMKSVSPTQLQSGLSDSDLNAIKGLPYFKFITPFLIESWPIKYNNQVQTMSIRSYDLSNVQEIWTETGISVAEGREFQPSDKYVTVIGQRVADGSLFNKKPVSINSNLLINGVSFKVVGIFNKFGDPQLDSAIHIPLYAARAILGNDNKQISAIQLVLKPGFNPDDAANATISALDKERQIKPGNEDFSVSTPDQLLSQANSILGVVQVVLLTIALIALVVGSIGIMNSTYTSVLERTKDIGVMRAVGATSSEVLGLFLLEAFITGIFGGVLGAIGGILTAKTFEFVASIAGFGLFKVGISWPLIIFSILFSGIIGVLAGYLPAKRASGLKPAEALRS